MHAEDASTLRERLAAIRATAESADGLIRVTVSGTGELVELRLDPRIHRWPDSTALARDITETMRRAAGQARVEGLAAAAGLLPADADPATADLRFDPVLHELDRQ